MLPIGEIQSPGITISGTADMDEYFDKLWDGHGSTDINNCVKLEPSQSNRTVLNIHFNERNFVSQIHILFANHESSEI